MANADIKLKIPSAVFYIDPVRAFVGNLAKDLGFSRKRVADIQLVVDEICSNAVHHGSIDATGGVKLQIRINTRSLEILVRDTGSRYEGQNSWLTHDGFQKLRPTDPQAMRADTAFLSQNRFRIPTKFKPTQQVAPTFVSFLNF